MRIQLGLLLATALPLAAQTPPADSIRSALTGTVRDSLGIPVSGASVLITPGGLIYRTDSAGKFIAPNMSVGPVTIGIRRLGFSPLVSQVNVPIGSDLVLDFTLQRLPQRLAEVEVTAERQGPRFAIEGILCRREVGNGLFINRQEVLAKSKGIYFPMLVLRDVPGFRQNLNGSPTTVESIVGWRCWKLVIDGGFVAGGMPIRRPQDIYAIEVYQPPDIPPEYRHHTWGKANRRQKYSTPCTVVVMWSMREAQRSLGVLEKRKK